MVKLKQQAETETMLAAALFRLGREKHAVDALNHAIDQLSILERNGEVQDAIRAGARKSLEDARAALAHCLNK